PFLAIGRLADAVSIADAQAELASIMADLERAFPENAARGVNVESYEEVTFGRVRRPLFVLLGAVVLVLLVACVNVANLLLARAEGRSREVAVRRALGASPSRIRGQFLVDSVLLTLLGAAGGLLLAHAALDTLVALAPPDIPRIADAALDVRVLAIATTASMLVCILFGLAPALDVRRVDLQHVLKAGAGRSATASHESRRLRESLVIAEVALAVALVISAGLLLRSFQALASVDPGFRTEGILKAEYQLDPLRYPMDFSRWPALPEINNFHATLLDRVGTLAGVRSAALAGQSPLDAGTTNGFVIEGREAESADMPEIRTRFITPGYLATLDVPLSAGRDISHSDVATSPRVALINRSAAERYFPGMDPAGHVLSFWSTSWRIVGVIGDERFSGVDSEPEPAVYAPLAQAPLPAATILLRTDRDAALLADDVRRTLRELDPALALSGVERLDVTLARTVARPRFIAVLLGLFAAVAASLAVIGVHGVISYGVARRTSEIGIRMALGATRASVLRLILAEGVALAAVGVAIGVVLAAAMARAVAALLFGVQPWDPATFGGVIVGMLACAVLASLLPARRAARAQPMAALRAE
ncbi:MAG: ADOP family duplicated permease, partial [Gemmatimonadota bacterium]